MKTASTYLLSVTVILVHLACGKDPRGSADGTWVAGGTWRRPRGPAAGLAGAHGVRCF